jgi:hypothetical protein
MHIHGLWETLVLTSFRPRELGHCSIVSHNAGVCKFFNRTSSTGLL